MISKTNAEHYLWGQGCDGWHLVKSAGLSVIQEQMPAGTSEIRHFHSKARQFFFVLSGTATLEIAGQREVLTAHEGVEVPPGVPHQIFNHSSSDVEFIVVSQPPSHGDRVLADAPAIKSFPLVLAGGKCESAEMRLAQSSTLKPS